MQTYIAGPMRGIPHFNFPAFYAAEEILKQAGYEVFNPARRDEEKYGKGVANPEGDEVTAAQTVGFNLREALQADTEFICLHADAIAMLPGWEKSKGAKAELALAEALGHKLLFLEKFEDGYVIYENM